MTKFFLKKNNIDDWNILPEYVVASLTVDNFKHYLGQIYCKNKTYDFVIIWSYMQASAMSLNLKFYYFIKITQPTP